MDEKEETDGMLGANSGLFVTILVALQREHYENSSVAGCNLVPAAIHWLRKGADTGNARAMGYLPLVVSAVSAQCSYCSKKSNIEAGEKFKWCAKCQAQWYCCKECQIAPWKAGHKQDCKNTGHNFTIC